MGQAMGQGVGSERTTRHVAFVPWIQRVSEIRRALVSVGWDTVNRAKFQFLFGLHGDHLRKTATRLMKKFGATGKPLVLSSAALLERLNEYEPDLDAAAELDRRQHFAARFRKIREERIESPKTLVTAPVAAARTKFSHIADQVKLEPGRITVEFATLEEAKKKLLLLAIAIGNEPDEFVRMVTP